jgi:hypothetical protein
MAVRPEDRPSDEDLAAAIDLHAGSVSRIAEALGHSRSNVRYWINRSKALREQLVEARESALDDAETALNKAAKDGQAWAVCFLLKTLGKGRGYVEKADMVAVRAVFAFVGDALKAAKGLGLTAHDRATLVAQIQKAAAKRFPEMTAPT